MTYYGRKWQEWADRLVVVVAVACLLVGLSVADARAADGERIDREPGVAQTPFPPVRLPVIRPDGVLAFDFNGTVAWSRYMVTETPPVHARLVWVLTYVNGPGGLRPLFLPAYEPVMPKE